MNKMNEWKKEIKESWMNEWNEQYENFWLRWVGTFLKKNWGILYTVCVYCMCILYVRM